MTAAALCCSLLLILLVTVVMLPPGMRCLPLLVQRTITMTMVLQERIGKGKYWKNVVLQRPWEEYKVATPSLQYPQSNLTGCLLTEPAAPHTSQPILPMVLHKLTMAFPVNVGPSAANQPWIPTPLADLSLVSKATNESGPDSSYFEQVLQPTAMCNAFTDF
ncbi:hypothetical protein STEG23_013576 [Scotinomys teguina]